MSQPMRIRASHVDGQTEVKVLISHPMEGGLRKDTEGKVIPAHFITDFTAVHNGKTVLKCLLSQSVSQNPYLAFKFKGGAKGEKVLLTWKDSKNEQRSDEVTIA